MKGLDLRERGSVRLGCCGTVEVCAFQNFKHDAGSEDSSEQCYT